MGRSPGRGNGNPLRSSCREDPLDRGAWWATVHGVAKSQTRLSDFTCLLMPLESCSNKILLTLLFFLVCCSGSVWTTSKPSLIPVCPSLSITNSRNSPKSMPIESVMPSNHLILCHPLLLLPSIFPVSRSFQMSQFFASCGQSIGLYCGSEK